MPPVPRKLVYVRWIDAKGPSDDWQHGDSGIHCEEVESIGFLIKRDKREWLLTQSIGEQDQDHRGDFAIPTVCILFHCELARPDAKAARR